MSATDYQVGGSHYRELAIQPVHYALANHLPFCEGNVVKYVTRWRQKGGIEDLRKARHYVQIILADSAYLDRHERERRLSKCGASWRDIIIPDTYSRANALPTGEWAVVSLATNFSNTGHRHYLTSALKWLDELIARECDD